MAAVSASDKMTTSGVGASSDANALTCSAEVRDASQAEAPADAQADVVTSCINPPEPLVCEPLSRSTAVSAPGVSLPPPRVNAPGLSVDAPTLGQRSLAFARRVLTNMKADIEADYGDLPNGSSGEWWVNLVDRTLGNIGARVDAEAEAQYAHLPEGTARRRLAEFSAKIDAAIKKNAAGVVMFPYWLAGHALAFCDSEEFRAAEIDGFVTAVTHPIENIKQGIEEVRRDPYTPAVGALASAGIAAMQLRGAPETTAPAPERSNVFDINGPLRPLRLHNANIRTMVYELRRVIGETQPLRYLTKNEAWDLIYRGLYILTPEADVGELIYARLVHGYRGTEIEILFFDWGSDEHHTGRVYRLSPQNSRGLIAWLKRDRDRLESLWRKPKVIR